jgi:ABC-type taurine transport system substrate-binding protein
VKQIEDLKGEKVAITRFGSATDFALRFAAEKWPIKPEKDFTALQLAGQPEMMAALKSGGCKARYCLARIARVCRKHSLRHYTEEIRRRCLCQVFEEPRYAVS